MQLFEKTQLSTAGKDYEIRVLHDGRTINVVAFRNNHPANSIRHQIKLPEKCNADNALRNGVAKELVEQCKDDLLQRRGERAWEIISESMRKHS